MTLQVLLYASLGGILPALTWLLFWLREDAKHPEPKSLIALTFIGGMIAVPVVFPIQHATYDIGLEPTELIFLWASFEEILKLLVLFLIAYWSKAIDEPIDAVIYMLTAALGFAALENTLFILNPLLEGNIAGSIITSSMRFIGASLLHVLASGSIGVFIALSFYKSKIVRVASTLVGLILAIVLHMYFNLFIMKETNRTAFATFGIVWIAIVILMLMFEKIKTINPRK